MKRRLGATGGRDNRAMGWYRDHVFVRLMNRMCNTAETRRVRDEVCSPLAGDVLEIGFGTGLNLPHLPSDVTRLLAVDPMERGQKLAEERSTSSSTVARPNPRWRSGRTA